MSKNGSPPATLMHVDQTLRLWAFLDVYGSTQKIRLFGTESPGNHLKKSLTFLVFGKGDPPLFVRNLIFGLYSILSFTLKSASLIVSRTHVLIFTCFSNTCHCCCLKNRQLLC